MERIKIRVPNYYDEFKCIGGTCPDTCCKHWNISIEKDLFMDYQNSNKYSDIDLKSAIDEVPKNQTDLNYGYMKLVKGKCSLLDSKNLCTLQSKYGHENLPLVCKLYPRTYTCTPEGIHLTYSLSCPEVSRIALSSSTEIDYINIYSEDPYLISLQEEYLKNLDSKSNLIQKNTLLLKEAVSKILNNTYYDSSEKILLIGMLINRLDKNNDNQTQFSNSVSGFMDDYEKTELKEYLKSIATNLDLQIDWLFELFQIKIKLPARTKGYKEYIQNFSMGLGLSEGRSYEDIKKNYHFAVKSYKKKKQILFDNMLLKYLKISFDSNLKFSSEYNDYSSSYYQIIADYNLMEFMLIGINQVNSLNSESIIEFIYSYTRLIHHSYTFNEDIAKYIYDNNRNSLAYVSILTKR